MLGLSLAGLPQHIVHKSLILSKHSYKFKFIVHCTLVCICWNSRKQKNRRTRRRIKPGAGTRITGSTEVKSWDFKLNGNLWLCGLQWSQSGAVNDSIMRVREPKRGKESERT